MASKVHTNRVPGFYSEYRGRRGEGQRHDWVVGHGDVIVASVADTIDDAIELTRRPRAFPRGRGRVPNNPIVRAALAAIMNAGAGGAEAPSGWSTDTSGHPRFRFDNGASGTVEIYPSEVEAGADVGRLNPDSVLRGLDIFAADVLLAALACLCAPETADTTKFPHAGSIAVDIDTILWVMGDRSSGARRVEQRRRVAFALSCIGALQVDVQRASGYDQANGSWSQRLHSWTGDRLISVVRRGTGPDTTFLLKFGQWTYWWLNLNGSVWMSEIAHGLLRLDRRESRRRELFAKKVGSIMTFSMPMSARQSVVQRRIGNLLRDIGELPPIEQRSSHWAGRTRDRLDDGLMRLVEMKLFSITWPTGLEPGDPDRARGWVDQWISSVISFHPYGSPAATLRHPKKRRAATGDTEGSAHLDLRRARVQLGLTQSALAAMLSISQPQLSRIERGLVKLEPQARDYLASLLKTDARE